jgi:fructose-bisphosphate aldolase, class II
MNHKELMERTRKEHFAVGAFNIDNLEIFKAVVAAAKKKQSPVLVEVSKGEVDFWGYDNIVDLVRNARDEGIEIFINQDHTPSVEEARKGVEAGFELIHLDVTDKGKTSYDDIVRMTKEFVPYAHEHGCLVEGELEYFAGSSNVHTETIDYEEIKKHFTDPEVAAKFIEETQIDTFAASIGNLHGLYPVPKKLDIELLSKIRDRLSCYISLHGGSGTPPHFFSESVKVGVSKININSEMRKAFRTGLEEALKQNPTEYAVPKIEGPVIDDIQAVVEAHMDVFGSSGKSV